jgi:hypothetical protein
MLPDLDKLLPTTPIEVALRVMLPVRESPDDEVESSMTPQLEVRLELPVKDNVSESVGSNAYMHAGPATAPLTARAATFIEL